MSIVFTEEKVHHLSNKNELLAKAEYPEKYYIEVIMQEKIRLYLEYVKKQSFLYDIALIIKTLKTIAADGD